MYFKKKFSLSCRTEVLNNNVEYTYNNNVNIKFIVSAIILLVNINPASCTNKNWWLSFDKQGWSTCGNDKLFITGFYRNVLDSYDKDQIYRLEEAKCCSSNSFYRTERSECKDGNWWLLLDR